MPRDPRMWVRSQGFGTTWSLNARHLPIFAEAAPHVTVRRMAPCDPLPRSADQACIEPEHFAEAAGIVERASCHQAYRVVVGVERGVGQPVAVCLNALLIPGRKGAFEVAYTPVQRPHRGQPGKKRIRQAALIDVVHGGTVKDAGEAESPADDVHRVQVLPVDSPVQYTEHLIAGIEPTVVLEVVAPLFGDPVKRNLSFVGAGGA